MKIKYLGPSESVNVGAYGPHKKDEAKDYPDDFGKELLATSKKQKFEAVGGGMGDMTVAELKAVLDEKKIEYQPNAKKADLIALFEGAPGDK
ncbi:MAG: HeH/LEM domain-containing protein [Desulfobacterales bacterium]|nr:HeH/LEM domain-containing protein [Desulfobacterales bacterium]